MINDKSVVLEDGLVWARSVGLASLFVRRPMALLLIVDTFL